MNNQKINFHLMMLDELAKLSETKQKPSLIIHSCCAPCSTVALERLAEYFDITIYFYNPNIHPRLEYSKREQAQRDFVTQFNDEFATNIKFVTTPYTPFDFFNRVKGLEQEKEGQGRCEPCFMLRLDKVAKFAKENDYDYFTTAITLGPKKDSQLLNKLGLELEMKYQVKFLPSDFKKDNGYKRSIELSKKYNIYRQCYCGCVFARMQQQSINV